MKKNFSKLLLGGAFLCGLSMSLTSCEDILGEWSRPTPVTPTVNPDVTPEPPANPAAVPLTLEAITAGTIVVANPQAGMQYSTDGGVTKTTMTATTTIPNTGVLAVGTKVEFYGNGTSITQYDGTFTGGTAEVKVYGNIMSLVDETGFADKTELPNIYTFYRLFKDNTKLIDASGLLLPATTLKNFCYCLMFSGCTSLTAAPKELPATDLTGGTSCYNSMFCGCTSLTAAPELKATTLVNNCYYKMFQDCKALTAAPQLPATTLKDYCYEFMFQDCKALTAAPQLPATTLKESCYTGMFQGCTSLTTAPKLPATTLAHGCYGRMFENCTSLTTAYVKAAYTNSNSECYNMFDGCTATGTKTLHTTTASKGSWDTAITNESWAGWSTANDWTD